MKYNSCEIVNKKWIAIVLFSICFIISSCSIKYSSLRSLKSMEEQRNDSITVAIYSEFYMLMEYSYDVSIGLRNIQTDTVYTPQVRDDAGNFYYFDIQPGKYIIDHIFISDHHVNRAIIFDHQDKKIIKTLKITDELESIYMPVNSPPPFGSTATGLWFRMDGLDHGDKELKYKDVFSKQFELLEKGYYHLGEYHLTGDKQFVPGKLPNITIKKVEINEARLKAFERYTGKDKKDINTYENILLSDKVVLDKLNVYKDRRNRGIVGTELIYD